MTVSAVDGADAQWQSWDLRKYSSQRRLDRWKRWAFNMLPRLMNPVGQNISQATVHKTSYGVNSEFTELCSFVLAGMCAPVWVSSLLCLSSPLVLWTQEVLTLTCAPSCLSHCALLLFLGWSFMKKRRQWRRRGVVKGPEFWRRKTKCFNSGKQVSDV